MDNRPKLSGRLVAALTLTLTALLMAARVGWVEPATPDIDPKGWAALPFAALLALAIAVSIGLASANRHRWHAVLRPNRGRVLGALLLAFITPFAVINWGPWLLGFVALFTLAGAAGGGLLQGFAALGIFAAVAVLWYPLACLIISGIHGRLMRLAIFALMFWASYSAFLVFTGTHGL